MSCLIAGKTRQIFFLRKRYVSDDSVNSIVGSRQRFCNTRTAQKKADFVIKKYQQNANCVFCSKHIHVPPLSLRMFPLLLVCNYFSEQLFEIPCTDCTFKAVSSEYGGANMEFIWYGKSKRYRMSFNHGAQLISTHKAPMHDNYKSGDHIYEGNSSQTK